MATVDIDLYYDLDRRRWTTSAGGLATQPSLFIGQSNDIDFKVRFVQGGVPIELTNPSWIAGIKVTDDPLGDYLLLTTTGTQTGTGATTIYTFSLNIDSVELQAYLVGITPTTNSTAFEVRDTVNNIATLPAITCSILPDYTLTGATPAAGSGTLVVDSGATFTVHKTFAMPTDDGQNTYVLKTNGAGVGSWAADSAGTGTVTSVAQSFTGGIVSVGGSPVTTSGTLALTILGTQGGIVYFASNSTWASSGAMGQGSLIVGGASGAPPNPVSAQTAGKVLISNGVLTDPIYSSTITLGASGTLGTITLGNATSGTILITPPTGALGTLTITLPSTSTTLAGLSVANTFTANQAFSGTISLVATTATAGQILQAGTRLLHTYGSNNLFVGSSAGKISGTIGSGNVSLGRDSLTSLTSGSSNTCLGDQSGYFITSGSSNMLIGTSAGVGISTGKQNIAMGVAALRTIVGNDDCTAIGHQALYSTTGAKNTGIGSNASWTCTSGSKNTFIGEYSGASTDTIGGLTGVGFTSGSNNTMLGQNTASTSNAGNYRTAIGSDSRCQSDNAIKLGRDYSATNAGDITILAQIPTANLPAASASNKGAIVYNTTDNVLYFSNGTSWLAV